MARPSAPLSLDGSSISSDYEESITSARTFDSLDELLSRFTLDFRPEYVLKIRNRLGPLVVGVDASHLPENRETTGALVIKPASEDSWWRRLRVSTAGNVTLRSRKLQWWVITLDLEGVTNPLLRTSSASFRVATKWDLSRGEYRNKRKMQLGDATQGRVHWHVNYNLPEVEGSFGADSRARSQEMHAEVGYAHADVSKLELVVWPMRNNPKNELYIGQQESRLGPSSSNNNSSSSSISNGTEAPRAVETVLNSSTGSSKTTTSSTNSADTAEDWVGKRLSDLKMHVGELQNWWETKK